MEAFVYCWTNTENRRKYVGYHTGTENDGYVCSSKSDTFWNDMKKDIFTRQIIAHGTTEQCVSLESAILDSIDINSDEWYNNANSKGIVFTEEVRKKMSENRIGKGSVCNASKRPEVKEMRRLHMLNFNPAKDPTVKLKLKASALERTKTKLECPHCGIISSIPVIYRWHFDNCKDRF